MRSRPSRAAYVNVLKHKRTCDLLADLLAEWGTREARHTVSRLPGAGALGRGLVGTTVAPLPCRNGRGRKDHQTATRAGLYDAGRHPPNTPPLLDPARDLRMVPDRGAAWNQKQVRFGGK